MNASGPRGLSNDPPGVIFWRQARPWRAQGQRRAQDPIAPGRLAGLDLAELADAEA